MKHLKLVLLLLIGMFSFTGFSATTDLTNDSPITADVISIDYPAMILITVSTAANVDCYGIMSSNTQTLDVPYLDLSYEDNYPEPKQITNMFIGEYVHPPKGPDVIVMSISENLNLFTLSGIPVYPSKGLEKHD